MQILRWLSIGIKLVYAAPPNTLPQAKWYLLIFLRQIFLGTNYKEGISLKHAMKEGYTGTWIATLSQQNSMDRTEVLAES